MPKPQINITIAESTAINVQLYDAEGNPIYLDDITARLDTIITLLTAIAQGGGIVVPSNAVLSENGSTLITEGGNRVVQE